MTPQITDRMLSVRTVMEMTSLSRTTIWRREREGTFPASVRLSANRVAWSLRAIEAWLSDCANDNRPQRLQVAA